MKPKEPSYSTIKYPYEATVEFANRVLEERKSKFFVSAIKNRISPRFVRGLIVYTAILGIGYFVSPLLGLSFSLSQVISALVILSIVAGLSFLIGRYAVDSDVRVDDCEKMANWYRGHGFSDQGLSLIEERARVDSSRFSIRSLAPVLLVPVILSLLPSIGMLANQWLSVPTIVVLALTLVVALGIILQDFMNHTHATDLIQHSIPQYKYVRDRMKNQIPPNADKLLEENTSDLLDGFPMTEDRSKVIK